MERRRRDAALLAELPEVVDLFVLAVGSGLTVALAVPAVARHHRGLLGEAFADVARRARLGARLADALAQVPDSLGERVRPLTTVLVSSERYGVALLPALERLAVETRLERRRAAEATARRVPVKLLFPLVLCTLPAALLTVVPLLAGRCGRCASDCSQGAIRCPLRSPSTSASAPGWRSAAPARPPQYAGAARRRRHRPAGGGVGGRHEPDRASARPC
ncbi:MAG: type II secretion system F family protein [Microthrixaceae bacterium]|nr:type II secretion system F family protein [Microthrixaceae bacterium]